MEQQFKYFAFISYNHKDQAWGKRIHRKLEYYKMPATLCSEHGWKRKPMRPIFFAPYDIQPQSLTQELQERLRASRNLIVVCSPNSAQSKYVAEEIKFFHELGRTNQIYFFIVDGQPHSDNPETECYNPIWDELGLPEMLGANIHEKIYRWPWLNRERAYVQLISKLLGVEFDAIWQRHKRLLIQNIITWIVGIALVCISIAGTFMYNMPVEVKIGLKETSVHNPNLPKLKYAIITLAYDKEKAPLTDTVHVMNGNAVFSDIPHKYLGKEVHLTAIITDDNCWESFMPVDTTILLSKSFAIDIRRNPTVYGNICFQLWKWQTEETSANTEIIIDGHRVVSDAEGYVRISIPLEEQKIQYPISSKSISLKDSNVVVPCGKDEIIEFK